MTISQLYRTSDTARPAISYELFPPRDPDPQSGTWAGIDKLLDSGPDYVSVTFGASGASQELTRTVLAHVLAKTGRPGLAHLTCVGRDRAGLERLVADMMAEGIRDFLALRGDPPRGQKEWIAPVGGLSLAAQLVELIREVAERELGDAQAVSIAVAAYPAGNVQSRTNAVAALADKQMAGADFAITQVFYQASDYALLKEAASYQGVRLPIVPGIIPFTDVARLRRLEGLSGVSVPPALSALEEIADPRERTRASLGATLDFLDDLLQEGVPGLHFYTFNRPRPVLDLVSHLRSRRFCHVEAEERAKLLDLAAYNLENLGS